jgi:hypothetical protein
VKNSKEKTTRLDSRDIDEAEKIAAKYQFKEIKETTSTLFRRQTLFLDMILGATELENMKPVKHLVTQHDMNLVNFF